MAPVSPGSACGEKWSRTSSLQRPENSRIVWVARGPQGHLIPPLCPGQGHLPAEQAAQILVDMIHGLQDEALADHTTPDISMEWHHQLIPLSLHDSLSDLRVWALAAPLVRVIIPLFLNRPGAVFLIPIAPWSQHLLSQGISGMGELGRDPEGHGVFALLPLQMAPGGEDPRDPTCCGLVLLRLGSLPKKSHSRTLVPQTFPISS